MNSKDQKHIDDQLSQLKIAMENIHAPDTLERRFHSSIKERAEAHTIESQQLKPKANNRAWIPVGIAASISLMSVLGYVQFNTERAVPAISTDQSIENSEYLVARVYSPLGIYSLSKGPEIHYQKSQMIHQQNQTIRISYVNLQKEE